MPYVTRHAVQRTKERVGLPKRLTLKNAKKAMENGIRHCETRGSLNRYITTLYMNYETANNVRIYCGAVYIFCGKVLVTVFLLPPQYRKAAEHIRRKKAARQAEQQNDRSAAK